MSITAECNSCGKQYQAPDEMAGRRVRCKSCGQIFHIPNPMADETSEEDQLAALERSFASETSLRTHVGQAHDDDQEQASEDDESSDDASRPLGRSSAGFDFAGAAQLDQFLPWGLVVLSLLALYAINADNESATRWLGWPRLGAELIAYAILVAPLTVMMIRKAAVSLGYQTPSDDKWRGFTAYLPALAIAAALWNAGDGAFMALILGSLLGVAVCTGFLWLLFRLRPAEIAPSAGFAAAGFFIGMALSGGIIYGLNLLLVNVLVQAKNPDMIADSPFGPGLPWITREQRQAILVSKPLVASKPNTLAAKPATPQPQGASPDVAKPKPASSSGSPLVLGIEPAPIPTPFDDLVRPLTESDYLVLVRHNGASDSLELWNDNTWTQRGSAVFPNNTNDRYVLSADGEKLARVATFPRLSVQIWSFSENRVIDSRELNDKQGSPQLIGFAGETRLLVRWQQDDKTSIEVIDTASSQKPKSIETLPFDLNANTLAISRDGTLAAIAAKADNQPTLAVYDLTSGLVVNRTSINSLDARWPVAPTGMGFSPDGRRIAILFEESGGALRLCYALDKSKSNLYFVNDHVDPSGPMPGRDTRSFTSNALTWLPDNKSYLLYGSGVFDQTSGRQLGTLGVDNPQAARVIVPDSVELLIDAGGKHQITQAHLNMQKLSSLLQPKPTTSAAAQ